MAKSSRFRANIQHMNELYMEFSEEEKYEYLCELFHLSDNPGFLMRVGEKITKMQKRDVFAVLPSELTFMILQRLPLEAIFTCRLVCKDWEKKISDSPIWFDLCTRAQFKLPLGLTPKQYMKSFIYLRDRVLNIQDHIETVEIKVDLAEEDEIAHMICNDNGTLLYCTDRGYLCALDVKDFSVVFRTRTMCQLYELRADNSLIIGIGKLLGNEGVHSEFVYTVYSPVDGSFVRHLYTHLPFDDMNSKVDCNERLGIFMMATVEYVDIISVSSGQILCRNELMDGFSDDDFTAYLIVSNQEEDPNLEAYLVYYMNINTASLKILTVDAKTHKVLYTKNISTGFSAMDCCSELGIFQDGTKLFIRFLSSLNLDIIKEGDLDILNRKTAINIYTFKLPSQYLDKQSDAGDHKCSIWNVDQISLEMLLPFKDWTMSSGLEDKCFLEGTGSAYNLLEIDGYLMLVCSDKHGINPLELLDWQKMKTKLKTRKPLVLFKRPENLSQFCVFTGNLKWLSGLGGGHDSGIIAYDSIDSPFNTEYKKITVLRWKPSMLEDYIWHM